MSDTPSSPDAPQEPRLWLVDGFNVLNVALLAGRSREAWWREEARDELLERARGFRAADASVWVVFDGPRPAEDAAGERVRSVFAPSADDWLLARIREEPERVAVVTADRRLADRARARGAAVVSPRDFLARCQVADSSTRMG